MKQESQSPVNFKKPESQLLNSTKENAKSFAMNENYEEGQTIKTIEEEISIIPSGFYLALALGSIVLSATLAMTSKRKEMANFVGLWAPSILILGLYNKIMKTHNSDHQINS